MAPATWLVQRRAPSRAGDGPGRPATSRPGPIAAAGALMVMAATLAGCKIERTILADPSQTATSVFINDASFNPDAMVAQEWEPKILPALKARAGPYADVAAAIAGSPDDAGARYGYREKDSGSPWTYVAAIDGTITGANTESRAATIDVKTSGGQSLTLQIGPVVRGTDIRNVLDFHPFSSFKNQVDYAQFGKVLNQKANAAVLSKLPRQDLAGRHVDALGVFQAGAAGAPPLVTPVEISVGPKP